MEIGKYCNPFFIYTTHVPKVIIFKKSRFAAPVAWAAYERVMLYLTAFDWHIWDHGAISQIKIETGSWNPSPDFIRVNSSTAQVRSQNCQFCHLLENKILPLKGKYVFSFKFLADDKCHLSVRLLWFKFINMTGIISVQILTAAKAQHLHLPKYWITLCNSFSDGPELKWLSIYTL